MARRICNTVHAAAMAFWMGSMVLVGAAAAIAFPTMKALAPRLAEYDKYPGDHWLIAAGQVMARVFAVSDIVQYVALALGVVSFLSAFERTRFRAVRSLIVLALVGICIFQALMLRPRMSVNLHQHWDAAKQGELSKSNDARAAFDKDHGLANGLLAANFSLAFLAMLLALPGTRKDATPGERAA